MLKFGEVLGVCKGGVAETLNNSCLTWVIL